MNNFSFCHNVFKSRLLQQLQNAYVIRKWLTKYGLCHPPTIIYGVFYVLHLIISKSVKVKHHWNRCGKRRNCSYWAISAFVTISSTLFNYHTIIYRDFLYFVLDNFKVICCRFVLCGKWLNQNRCSVSALFDKT